MDYYERKRRAILMIDSACHSMVTVSDIVYNTEREFGFGENFVIKRLKTLYEQGLIKYKDPEARVVIPIG